MFSIAVIGIIVAAVTRTIRVYLQYRLGVRAISDLPKKQERAQVLRAVGYVFGRWHGD